MQRTVNFALVLLCCLGSVALAEDDIKDDGHTIPGHHIESSGGVAYHEGKTGSYVGIEYEGSELSEDEGIRATKALLERVRDELAADYE